jgi:cell division septation protein DedD
MASAKGATSAVVADKPVVPEPVKEIKQPPTITAKDSALPTPQPAPQPNPGAAKKPEIALLPKEPAIDKFEKTAVTPKLPADTRQAQEAKGPQRLDAEQARTEGTTLEPDATKKPASKPIQEAALQKELPQEGKKTGAIGSAPAGERMPPAKDSSIPTEAVAPAKESASKEKQAVPEASLHSAPKQKATEGSSQTQLALKSVEGYVVQVSFRAKTDAQRWSEILAREGYTTSITSIGEGEAVRLRVGSFPSQASANTLLGRLKKEGLNGFVVQVPKG